MYEATGWGQGAVPDIEAAGKAKDVTLVGKETFNLKDQDLSAQLIRLRDAGADTLIYWGVDPGSAGDAAQPGAHRLEADHRQRLGHQRQARRDRGPARGRRARRRHLRVDRRARRRAPRRSGSA